MSFHIDCDVFVVKNQKVFKVEKNRKQNEETDKLKNAFIY